MEKTFVTGQTLIGEIVANYPDAVDVLYECGMHCIGCPASQMESLEEACAVHGVSADELVELFSAKTTDAARLARAVELMEESGAIERVRGRARELVDEAKGHLASADFSPRRPT